MRELRRIQRHHLPYYLKVFNSNTDKLLGYIGNVSLDGLMLVSQWPMLVGARFDMRLKVPGHNGRLRFVDFQADCQWSRADINPGHFDSGFSLASAPLDYVYMVEALHSYFTFNWPRAVPEPDAGQ